MIETTFGIFLGFLGEMTVLSVGGAQTPGRIIHSTVFIHRSLPLYYVTLVFIFHRLHKNLNTIL